MARIKELFEMYKDVDEEKLFNNLVYFLKQSSLYVKSTISVWRSIQMILHGLFSVFPVSLPIRSTS